MGASFLCLPSFPIPLCLQDTAAMVGKQLNVAFIECCKDRKVLTMSEKVAQTYK